jgi:hypothetical protein
VTSPLWEVLNEAYRCGYEDPASGLVLHRERVKLGHSAELYALADWIEKRQIETYAAVIPDVAEVIGWLRAEAERAEGQA